MNPYVGYYQNQIGHGIPGFRGFRRQKGYGWLSSLFSKAIMPLFKTIKNVDASKGLKVLQDIAKTPGTEPGRTIADDIAKLGTTAAGALIKNLEGRGRSYKKSRKTKKRSVCKLNLVSKVHKKSAKKAKAKKATKRKPKKKSAKKQKRKKALHHYLDALGK